MPHIWVIESATGRFVYGGTDRTDLLGDHAGLSPGQAAVTLDRAPDPRAERYDVGSSAIVTQSAGEIAAHVAEKSDQLAEQALRSDRAYRVLGAAVGPLAAALRADPVVLRQQIRDAVKAELANEIKGGA